jgi:hypothetical protein
VYYSLFINVIANFGACHPFNFPPRPMFTTAKSEMFTA